MKESVTNFSEHVRRVKEQYRSLRSMKDNLPDEHAIIQMDFSENYTCQSMEEIQSAYWNASMVALHPCVIYFKQDGNLSHKSTVFVSNVLHHNSSMVYAIVEKVMAKLKADIPALKFVHFWTDSPTSQYRNKYIFDLVSEFENRFNVKCSWQYFEAGHGKSTCDGIGGSTKRNADNAVKRGTIIQDANDFFAWAIQSDGEIGYEFVTEEEFLSSKSFIEGKIIKPVAGTMSFHSVTCLNGNVLLTRTTTCVFNNCFSDDGFNKESACGWTRHTLRKTYVQPANAIEQHGSQTATDGVEDIAQVTSNQTETGMAQSTSDQSTTYITHGIGQSTLTDSPSKVDDVEELQLAVGSHVLAVYDKIIYIGKILELDDKDNTVNITCMKESENIENQYKWPGPKPDEVWVYKADILKVIPGPIDMGRSRRLFKLSDDTLNFIRTFKA